MEPQVYFYSAPDSQVLTKLVKKEKVGASMMHIFNEQYMRWHSDNSKNPKGARRRGQ